MRNLTFALIVLISVSSHATAQESGLLSLETNSGKIKEIRTTAQWKQKRAQILKGMQEAMGKLPARSGLPAFGLTVTDSLKENAYTRLTIRITVAEGETLPAYLYIPSHIAKGKKNAAMLVLHGTGDGGKKLVDGESPLSNRALAKELAQRGYVVIAPDYPSMGELKDYNFKTDRYESGTMKAIFNHIRCVDFLSSLSYVDAGRIGVIGHSLGGHNAMFAAAFDERLKVVVASCGWTLMDYYNIGEAASARYGGRLGPWAQDRYMPLLREKYNLDGDRIPFDFDEVIAALAPRPFFSNSPVNDSNFDVAGVRKGIASAGAVYRLLNASQNLQVRYPEAGHDFPLETRREAFEFIDSVLKHTPQAHSLK